MPDSEKGFKPESLYKSVYDKLGSSVSLRVRARPITNWKSVLSYEPEQVYLKPGILLQIRSWQLQSIKS